MNIVKCCDCKFWMSKTIDDLELWGICPLLTEGGCTFKREESDDNIWTNENFGCTDGERSN